MSKATIHYHDIGDYLNREEKLAIVKKFGSVSNILWKKSKPNIETTNTNVLLRTTEKNN